MIKKYYLKKLRKKIWHLPMEIPDKYYGNKKLDYFMDGAISARKQILQAIEKELYERS